MTDIQQKNEVSVFVATGMDFICKNVGIFGLYR